MQEPVDHREGVGSPDRAAPGEGSGLLGIGLYTAGEAGRLLRVPPRRLRRWLQGYDYRYRGERREQGPLWRPQLPELDGHLGLGFLDLMELRVVIRFLDAGLSLRTMRLALARAREVIGGSHPLATARFRTDGRTIFLEIADRADEPRLYDLLGRQYGLHRIIEPSLKDVDFEGDGAVRWWPSGRRRAVVIDPERSFGQPVAHPSGVPTATLAAAAEAEGSARAVTRWFDTTEREVRDAVAFERRLSA